MTHSTKERIGAAPAKVEKALSIVERACADAVAGMKAADRRRVRIDRGMCPECGREAAPYYLCPDHRSLGAMSRLLNKMSSRGIITKSRKGRESLWQADGSNTGKIADYHWGKTIFEMEADDKRLRPRINRRPVDLDETMFAIFRDAAKPLSMEEVYAAWGKLRSKRKTGSLAGDMAAIIEAQRRRDARTEKRRKLVDPTPSPPDL